MTRILAKRASRYWLTTTPVLLASLSAGAIATAADDDKLQLEEVIVTANTYQEDIAEQPVSVTEFNAEQRNLTATASATDMYRLTPGIELSDRGVTIRGVGRTTPTSSLGTTEPVAYYVNGFYLPDSSVIGENTLIGGNVQILRGPQGTRYGTNAIGGAANLISRVPTDTFRGEALIGYGRYDWNTQGFTVSGPLSENYGARFSVQRFAQPERSQKNIGPVEAGFDSENLYAEFQLDGQVTDDLHFLLRSSTFSYDNARGYTAPAVYNNAAPFQGSNIPNVTYNYDKNPPQEPRVIDVDVEGYDKLKDNQVHILNADWNLGPATLYYVGGYQAYKTEGNGDYDATSRIGYVTGPGNPGGAIANGLFISTSIVDYYFNDDERYSHELRLEGNEHDDLEWNVGLYYSKGKYDRSYAIGNPNQPELANPVYRYYNGAVQAAPIAPNPNRDTYRQHNLLDVESRAVFAQATYALTDKLQLTAGARYTEDESTGTNEYFNFYWDTFFTGDVTPLVNGATTTVKDEEITGRIAADFQATDSASFYLSVARGSKPSSLTLDNIVPDPAQGGRNNVSDPEELIAYELGWKQLMGSEFFGTVALFFNDYTDMQIPLTVYLPNPIAGLPNIPATRYDNVDTEIYGAEIEGTWTPTPDVWVRANYTYTHGEYTAMDGLVIDPTDVTAQQQSIVGNQLSRIPRHKASLAGYYTFDFTPGSLILGGSVYYAGERYWSYFNTDTWKMSDYTVVNASATWRAPDNRYEVNAACSNLLDDDYVTAIGVAGPDLGLARTNYLGAARFYSLQVRVRF
ncbi:iron complex outermembrane receptor protein [Povalibacter uvarum]|uniref:Iron complex outermembrane receptor protein n=1 Tax=Povalibacter uvarum TaxID=732238 RepID=A0A841HKC5_9GAMM|nr:TonB-dependent receptor [Povalibacter uvarum]MBB6093497.1 iron complex outermembrane receptor protein [Povalibacter uvarum]